MSSPAPTEDELSLITAQLGRVPRTPFRVASRCVFGFPTTIVSPSLLSDETPFPAYAWLTCPWLAERVGALESSGEIARWSLRAANDGELAAALSRTDVAVRDARAAESGGADACAHVGIAGQRDPLGVKCLHAHVALELAGISDRIGSEVLGSIGDACDDGRCASLETCDTSGGRL